jgi:hypothetical protein
LRLAGFLRLLDGGGGDRSAACNQDRNLPFYGVRRAASWPGLGNFYFSDGDHGMRLLFSLGVIGIAGLSGCTMNAPGAIDPFTNYGTPYAEFGCSYKDKDGHCLKATCKADAQSNCDDWAAGCLRHDGYLQGTSESATCSKIL